MGMSCPVKPGRHARPGFYVTGSFRAYDKVHGDYGDSQSSADVPQKATVGAFGAMLPVTLRQLQPLRFSRSDIRAARSEQQDAAVAMP